MMPAVRPARNRMLRSRPARRRAGMTLVECLVALALAGLVSAAVGSVLASQARVLRVLTAQAGEGDAFRIAASVLHAELRLLVAGSDVRSIAGDSIAVRVFRGTGLVCAQEAERLLVLYRGDRLPDPEKDSVLVTAADLERAHALRAAEAATCAGRAALALRLEPPPPAYAAAVLVFESGTYFLRDRALRYRLGGAGRQPLTDERFASSGPPLRFDSLQALVPLAWPPGLRRPADTLRFRFVNGRE